jgi:hypothetical protein
MVILGFVMESLWQKGKARFSCYGLAVYQKNSVLLAAQGLMDLPILSRSGIFES